MDRNIVNKSVRFTLYWALLVVTIIAIAGIAVSFAIIINIAGAKSFNLFIALIVGVCAGGIRSSIVFLVVEATVRATYNQIGNKPGLSIEDARNGVRAAVINHVHSTWMWALFVMTPFAFLGVIDVKGHEEYVYPFIFSTIFFFVMTEAFGFKKSLFKPILIALSSVCFLYYAALFFIPDGVWAVIGWNPQGILPSKSDAMRFKIQKNDEEAWEKECIEVLKEAAKKRKEHRTGRESQIVDRGCSGTEKSPGFFVSITKSVTNWWDAPKSVKLSFDPRFFRGYANANTNINTGIEYSKTHHDIAPLSCFGEDYGIRKNLIYKVAVDPPGAYLSHPRQYGGSDPSATQSIPVEHGRDIDLGKFDRLVPSAPFGKLMIFEVKRDPYIDRENITPIEYRSGVTVNSRDGGIICFAINTVSPKSAADNGLPPIAPTRGMEGGPFHIHLEPHNETPQ